jgi:hypothetical protein
MEPLQTPKTYYRPEETAETAKNAEKQTLCGLSVLGGFFLFAVVAVAF